MPAYLLFALCQLGFAPPCDTVAVCPPELWESLQPWVDYRTRQGRVVALADGDRPPAEIRAAIRDHARGGALRFVLLVGDADPRALADDSVRRRSVPTRIAPAVVNVRYGSPPLLATDNWFADLDDDGAPDVAVGRLTADSSDELTAMIDRIQAYEVHAHPGAWQRRISLVAGVSGMGPLIDVAIESATRRLLLGAVPPEFDALLTQARWESPFCPSPAEFHRETVERFNEGCLFWVYSGHGSCRALDRLRLPDAAYRVFDHTDAQTLQCRHGSPIAILMCCHAGAYDAEQDCLAEEMLRAEGGPIAVLAASRVTMPYGMIVLGRETIAEYFSGRPKTLGELVLAAKRQAIAPDATDELRRSIDNVAAAFSDRQSLVEERGEHVQLFNLLGDPLLQLIRPAEISFDSPAQVRAGEEIDVQGASPGIEEVEVELVVRRDRLAFEPPPREAYPGASQAADELDTTYARANDRRLAAVLVATAGGRFRAKLRVPAEAIGHCHVRVFQVGGSRLAAGARDLHVLAAEPAP